MLDGYRTILQIKLLLLLKTKLIFRIFLSIFTLLKGKKVSKSKEQSTMRPRIKSDTFVKKYSFTQFGTQLKFFI